MGDVLKPQVSSVQLENGKVIQITGDAKITYALPGEARRMGQALIRAADAVDQLPQVKVTG